MSKFKRKKGYTQVVFYAVYEELGLFIEPHKVDMFGEYVPTGDALAIVGLDAAVFLFCLDLLAEILRHRVILGLIASGFQTLLAVIFISVLSWWLTGTGYGPPALISVGLFHIYYKDSFVIMLIGAIIMGTMLILIRRVWNPSSSNKSILSVFHSIEGR